MRGEEVIIQQKSRQRLDVYSSAPDDEMAVRFRCDDDLALFPLLGVERFGLSRSRGEPEFLGDTIETRDVQLVVEEAREGGERDDIASGDEEVSGGDVGFGGIVYGFGRGFERAVDAVEEVVVRGEGRLLCSLAERSGQGAGKDVLGPGRFRRG